MAGKARLMGQNDAHLAFALKQKRGAVRVVAFRQAWRHEAVAAGRALDLVVTPALSEWNGVRAAELRLVDLRTA